MTTLTISLPDSLKDFINQQVETQGYGNTSEYVRTLLREAEEAAKNKELESLLLEGLASGEAQEANSEFWNQLRQEAATLLKKYNTK